MNITTILYNIWPTIKYTIQLLVLYNTISIYHTLPRYEGIIFRNVQRTTASKSRKTNLVDETKGIEDAGKGKEEKCNRSNNKRGSRRKQKTYRLRQ